MAAPGTWEVLRFCFSGGGRSTGLGGVAVLSAWCLTLAILVLNAFFRLLLQRASDRVKISRSPGPRPVAG